MNHIFYFPLLTHFVLDRFYVQEKELKMNFPPEKQSERLASAIESLKNKGYAFNNDKRMVQISVDGVVDDSKGFEFVVRKEDRAFNQKNYEQIGDILTEYVYGVLESDPINFVRREFPEDQGKKHLKNATEIFPFIVNDAGMKYFHNIGISNHNIIIVYGEYFFNVGIRKVLSIMFLNPKFKEVHLKNMIITRVFLK